MTGTNQEPTDLISQEEILEMFGEYMPIEAARLLSEASPYDTVGQVRARLREIAKTWRPETKEEVMSTDRFETLARKIHKRTTSPEGFNHRLGTWSMSDWMVAMLGEFGEAANCIKKLNRIRDGLADKNKKGETQSDLLELMREEIGDGFSYLILFCQAAGIDLLEVTEKKFDTVSKEIGYVEEFRSFGHNETETSLPEKDTHSG